MRFSQIGSGLMLAIAMLLTLPAEAELRSSHPVFESGTLRRVIHYDGIEVSVPKKVTRIASAWEAQNSVLVMLGAGAKIVATTRYAQQMKAFQQIVPSIKNAALATMGHAADVNVERLISLHPDILFVPEGFPANKQHQLEQAGIAVAAFHANSFNELLKRVKVTAQLLAGDAPNKAQSYIDYVKANQQLVANRLTSLPRTQRKRVYIASGMPLLTSGRPSLNQDWIDLAGGINVAENWHMGPAHYGSANVDFESVLAAHPDVIVTLFYKDAQRIRQSSKWQMLDAVKQQRVYANPRGLFWWCRETSEEALQFLWLAKKLYPQRFNDIDLHQRTTQFYQQFYGTAFSPKTIAEFLNPQS